MGQQPFKLEIIIVKKSKKVGYNVETKFQKVRLIRHKTDNVKNLRRKTAQKRKQGSLSKKLNSNHINLKVQKKKEKVYKKPEAVQGVTY